jgi:putative salt-induced outer membrane protein
MSGVDTTTANPFRLGGRYDDNVSERLFAFGGGEADTNRAGGVDLRWALNGGVGHRVIRTEQNGFDLAGGLGCSDTAFTDATQRNGAGLLFGEEPSHKLGDSTSAKQRPIVYPGSSDVGTRATWDAGLAMAIIGGRTLNTGLSCRYAGTVAAGLKTSDTP